MAGHPFLAASAIALAVTVGACGGDEPPAPSDGPNIVLITSDDQALDSFNRKAMPETMRLLVDGGTVPGDFTVTTPLCCPSRASLLTGQYGHNNGVLANRYRLLENPESTLPVWLRDAGYRTAHVGKYLNNYEKDFPDVPPAPGWEEWATVIGASYFDYEVHLEDGGVQEHGTEPADYLSRVITRQARRMIAGSKDDERPLFLQADYYAPHADPSGDRRCNNAALPDPRDADLFARARVPRTPSFNEAEVSDLPAFLRQPALTGSRLASLESDYRCTLAAMRGVDRGIGEIFEALQDAGELDETVVVYMSDNGLLRGQHRFGDSKHVAFEETQRVPIAMRVPAGLLDSRAPATLRGPAANIDIAPTLLDLAGAEPCTAGGDCRVMDGISLVPALKRKEPLDPRRALLVEIDENADPTRFVGPCRYRGLRVEGLFYLEHESAQSLETGECVSVQDRELYDLRRDPFQLRNLLPPGGGDPRSEELAETLSERVERMHDCEGIRGRDPRPPAGVSYCG